MPILTIKAIHEEKICSISKELVDELEEIIKCPREYFTIEAVKSIFFRDGNVVDGYPIVEISWFDRGQEIQDKVAMVVTKYVKAIGYENVDVIFHTLEETKYYENGKHF